MWVRVGWGLGRGVVKEGAAVKVGGVVKGGGVVNVGDGLI